MYDEKSLRHQAVRWLCSTAKAVADFTHKVQELSALADHILVMLDLADQVRMVRTLDGPSEFVIRDTCVAQD